MREYRFGLFCSLSDNSLSTNHTCTLKRLNKENVILKVRQNANEFVKLLEFAKTHNLKTFRLGNSFIPFLSHDDFETSWKKEIRYILDETKEKIKHYQIRITQHPGQYIVLNSLNKEVIQKSLSELRASFWLFDSLGIDENGIVLIHGGGGYGDKELALERLVDTIEHNSWLKERLALENDERIFTAEEIAKVCLHVKIPFIFDIYHHSLNPSFFSKEDFLKSYQNRRPKVHISSKGEGKFGNHGDFIEKEDFQNLVNIYGEELYSIDIMIEAKQKEKAIEKLRGLIA